MTLVHFERKLSRKLSEKYNAFPRHFFTYIRENLSTDGLFFFETNNYIRITYNYIRIYIYCFKQAFKNSSKRRIFSIVSSRLVTSTQLASKRARHALPPRHDDHAGARYPSFDQTISKGCTYARMHTSGDEFYSRH